MSEIEPRRRLRQPPHSETEQQRILKLLQQDGYFEALYAFRTIRLGDIGVVISVGQEPLRIDGDIVGADLLKAGRKERLKLRDIWEILAFQLAAFRSNRPIDFVSGWVRRPGILPKDLLQAAMILVKDEPFSFFVAQTTLAIIKWDLSEDIDPRIFLTNYCLYEEPVASPVEDAWTFPKLVGSVLVEVEEGAKKRVFLQSRGASSKKFWSLAGGHYDNMTEIAALAELREEMGLPGGIIRKAVPLCVANQAFLVGSGDEQKRVKYLNIAWRLAMTATELKENPPNAESGRGEWQLFSGDKVREMASQGLLSPIALCALVCAGYLDLADFPEVTMPNRIKYK